jgi:hypothetical protein
MNPIISHVKGKPDSAHLIDMNSFHFLPESKDRHSKKRPHFMSAVDIGGLSAGEVEIDTNSEELVRPRPCVVQLHKKVEESGIRTRGIESAAAEVLLNLALAFNNPEIEPARGKWAFQEPAERETVSKNQGWSQWLFIAAWRWSVWDGLPGRMQFQQMTEIGYPNTEVAFRKMMKLAGLTSKNRERNRRPGNSYQ